MRRTAYVAGAIAISAAAIFVWSHYAMEQPRASAKPIAAEAAIGISPLEMMMQKRDKPLPVESIENPI